MDGRAAQIKGRNNRCTATAAAIFSNNNNGKIATKTKNENCKLCKFMQNFAAS